MTDTKHTPTPWPSETVEQIWLAGINKLFADGMLGISVVNAIIDKVANADAAHIVKCVNLHEELVEALKFMYDNYDEYIVMKRLAEIEETLKKAGAL